MNEFGRAAIVKYSFPPFIDASCRREPDLENMCPSITALCRQGRFAPYLREGDIVVYLTVQGNYSPIKEKHHRVVAVLQIETVYNTHQQGKSEYSKLGITIPSNCMVKGNLPYDFDKTAGNFKTKKELEHFLVHNSPTQLTIGQRRLKHWDKNYLDKAQQWPCFIKTKALYKNVISPTPIFRTDFERIFNKLPNTRTPNKISENQFTELCKLLEIDVLLGKKIE